MPEQEGIRILNKDYDLSELADIMQTQCGVYAMAYSEMSTAILEERKKMRNKLEQKLDAEFEEMEERVFIFHIHVHCDSFISSIRNVTFAVTWRKWEWDALRHLMEYFIPGGTNMATRLLNALKDEGLYGVAICDKRDQFNRQRGRIIAKGRLLKHLKEMKK